MANPSVLDEAWSNEVWQWRVRFGEPQVEMAAYVYVSPATWSRWERGVCEPPAYVKVRVRHELQRLYDLRRQWGPPGRVAGTGSTA